MKFPADDSFHHISNRVRLCSCPVLQQHQAPCRFGFWNGSHGVIPPHHPRHPAFCNSWVKIWNGILLHWVMKLIIEFLLVSIICHFKIFWKWDMKKFPSGYLESKVCESWISNWSSLIIIKLITCMNFLGIQTLFSYASSSRPYVYD